VQTGAPSSLTFGNLPFLPSEVMDIILKETLTRVSLKISIRNNPQVTQEEFDKAIGNGHLDVVQWLVSAIKLLRVTDAAWHQGRSPHIQNCRSRLVLP
jgi:hypothetical protein